MTRTGTKAGALAVCTALALVGTGSAAFADNINDTVADNGAGVVLAAGDSAAATAAQVKVQGTSNNDGEVGCNIDPQETFVLRFTAPTGVTVADLAIPRCDEFFSLQISTAANAVSGTITAAILTNTTGRGQYNNNVAIPVTITAPANTAPSVTVTGVTAGRAYDRGAVPSASCSVADAEDAGEGATASLSEVTGPYASDGIGSQTATCTYTDAGGLTDADTVTYSIVDPSAPLITSSLTPALPDGLDGWYRSDVALDWTVTEGESAGSLRTTGCDDQTVAADQQSVLYDCSASSAGGSAAAPGVRIKRDATRPEVSGSDVVAVTGTWTNEPVTRSFTAQDATSGLPDAADRSFDLTAAAQSSDAATPTTVERTVTDAAGNSRTRTVSAYIDLSAPTAAFAAGAPADGAVFWTTSVPQPAAVGGACADTLSGVSSCTVHGFSRAAGTHTISVTATDRAGNTTTSATRSYTVRDLSSTGFYSPVDMGGVINTVKGGSTVPLKFNLQVDGAQVSDTALVTAFTATKVTCNTAGADDIEMVTTGATVLRWDATGGQFVQNWKTPTGAGTCYQATATLADGDRVTALFKLK